MTICDNCAWNFSCEEHYLVIDGLERCPWYEPIEDCKWFLPKEGPTK